MARATIATTPTWPDIGISIARGVQQRDRFHRPDGLPNTVIGTTMHNGRRYSYVISASDELLDSESEETVTALLELDLRPALGYRVQRSRGG